MGTDSTLVYVLCLLIDYLYLGSIYILLYRHICNKKNGYRALQTIAGVLFAMIVSNPFGAEEIGFVTFVITIWLFSKERLTLMLALLTSIAIIFISNLTSVVMLLICKHVKLTDTFNVIVYLGISAGIILLFLLTGKNQLADIMKSLLKYPKKAVTMLLATFSFLILINLMSSILIINIGEKISYLITIAVTVFTTAFLLIVFNFYQDTVTKLENTALVAEQARQMKAFQLYLQEINDYYQEIANFRHDYKNLLLTLGNRIAKSGDADLQAYYQQMVIYSDQQIRGVIKPRNLAQLEQIELQSLRSVILAKLTKANQLGIETQLNVTGWVQGGRVNELELARIVAILLDNAIEASSKQEQKWLGIGLDSYGEDGVDILIENKFTGDKAPNLTAWFERGYTTKGSNHGRGLSIVNQLCDKNLIDLEVEYKRGLVCFILGIGV